MKTRTVHLKLFHFSFLLLSALVYKDANYVWFIVNDLLQSLQHGRNLQKLKQRTEKKRKRVNFRYTALVLTPRPPYWWQTKTEAPGAHIHEQLPSEPNPYPRHVTDSYEVAGTSCPQHTSTLYKQHIYKSFPTHSENKSDVLQKQYLSSIASLQSIQRLQSIQPLLL